MNTSSRQWLEMVLGSNTLLKIKGWVPMSPKPLLVPSLKTTTLHGCMITNKKTGSTLLTEHNLAAQENEDSNDDNDKWIFCSDLDKIEIALPNDGGDD
jgi:hypothetical protein